MADQTVDKFGFVYNITYHNTKSYLFSSFDLKDK